MGSAEVYSFQCMTTTRFTFLFILFLICQILTLNQNMVSQMSDWIQHEHEIWKWQSNYTTESKYGVFDVFSNRYRLCGKVKLHILVESGDRLDTSPCVHNSQHNAQLCWWSYADDSQASLTTAKPVKNTWNK